MRPATAHAVAGRRRRKVQTVRKPILLVAVVAGVVALVRKRGSNRATASLWREATETDPGAPKT
jgi:hypothetical protein